MAIARKRGASARNISLNIWLSPAEKNALRERAGTQPVSTWLRNLALGQKPNVRDTHRQERIVAHARALSPLILAIAKIGNNLNQIARQVNTDTLAGRAVEVIEIRLALRGIQASLAQIQQEAERACKGLSPRKS